MKSLFLILTLVSSLAWGQSKTLSDGGFSGKNNVYVGLVPYAQDVGFAAAYELEMNSTVGYGGSFTILPEEDTAPIAVGLLAIGGFVRLHFPISYFDIYISPGMNIMMMEIGALDDTSFGPNLAVGFLAQVTPNVALGLEYNYFHPWFNEDFYVFSRAYFQNTAATLRFSF